MIKSTIKSLSPQHIKSTVIGNTNVMVSSTVKEGGDVEIDPVFRNSVAYNITQQDVDYWNAGAGVDLSAYVTKEQLVNQSYITINDVTYPDYSNTYQAKGEYITPTQLVNQSYITINDVTYPDYSNTYQAVGDYVTASDLSQQSYLTSETDPVFSASVAANITQQDVDNWNTGASVDLSSYVSKQELSELSYVTASDLSQQSYLTSETDPIFSQSPAASITDTDISNWNAAAGTIDMSAYVTKNELVNQSYITINDVTFPDYSNTYQAKGNYVTTTDLSQQSYLTSESDPVFSASVAAGITQQDVDNWNAGGAVDLSSYVTYEFLSSQAYITPSALAAMSYVTQSDIVFPDYSATYQSAGDYVTPSQLVAQGYISSESDPIFSASPAAGITAQDIQNWNTGAGIDWSSYVTKSELANQSYITLNDIVYPDYSNTYQTKGDYVTKSQLSAQSYLTNADMSAYVAKNTDTSQYVRVRKLTNDTRGELSLMVYDENNYWTRSELDLQNNYVDLRILDNSKPWVYSGNMWISAYDVNIDGIKIINIGRGVTVADVTYTPKTTIGNAYLDKGYIKYGSNNQYVPIASYTYVVEKINQYPASTITTTDIANWNTGATIDLSTYVTKQQLSNQSYVTNWTNDNDQIITVSSDFTTADTKRRAGIRTRSDDAAYCASFISSIENNYGNTYYVYAGVEANYGEDKKSGIYATNAGVGLTALDGNIRLASPNIRMDYKNKVSFVASYDYVGETLAAQSYITINDVVFPDYSDTYQAVGDYVTPAQLSGQSYIKADYLTTNRYLKSSYAFTGATSIYTEGMSIYNGNVFPSSFSYTGVNDTTYYDTFASIRTMKKYVAGFLADVLPNYTTKTELDAQSYVTSTALSGMSYTSVQIVTEAQYEDRQDNILYVISDAEPVSDLITRAELMTILANYMPKPDIIYETDGTTGLLGENANSMNLTNWQLQNLDFTPYRYVLAFIKQADLPLSGTNNQYATPALVVYIPLDAASKSTQYDAYIGSTGGTNMNDPDVHFIVQCAIDSTKTKFKVVNEGSVAGTIWGDRNNNGRYCYKIEGYK